MKKIVKIISVLLIVLIGACFFVACGEKKPVLKGVLAYEFVYEQPLMSGTVNNPDICGMYDLKEMEDVSQEIGIPLYSLTYRPNLTIKSVKDLPKDKIVYTTVDRSGIKNGVVVNKWMYYYSLMVANGEKIKPKDEKYAVANEALNSDAFTMEKAAINDWAYCIWEGANFVESTSEKTFWHGKPDDYKRNLPPYEEKIMESIEKLFSSKKYAPKMTRGEAEEGEIEMFSAVFEGYRYLENALCYEYAVDRSQLKVAAMQRYGYIDVNQMERGIGKLKVWYDTDVPQIGEKDMPILEEIPVIGYYESEADKLMSTGVPRDVQSDAYKLVFEQLYNPTFYLA